MPRYYKRTVGSRKYADYTPEKLEECLNAVRSREMSERQASANFNISRSTIRRKLNDVVSKKYGRPQVFTFEEELAFASHLNKICDLGFQVDKTDLRFIVKSYLEMIGRSVKCFRNNMPGPDWVEFFLKRHAQLSIRFAKNIKRARAAILDEKVIIEFIDNLSAVTKDVPPENIYNYDEMSMFDDHSGRKHDICRRSYKINSTKSSVSVMFCGNAAGSSLPPYVIYKAEQIRKTWLENGPVGARYNRSKHGWIDLEVFEDWFTVHLLPVLKNKEGTKIVIGDNLTSRFSLKVIKLCEEHNIQFVCLPPNSSHLMQPLDLAYFTPLKNKWNDVLTEWKMFKAGKKVVSVPKKQFPMLLRTVLDKIGPNIANNLKAGFKKVGIFPTSKDTILSLLPKQDSPLNLNLVGEAFLTRLDQKRQEFVKLQARKKNNRVRKGKIILDPDIQPEEESEAVPSCAKPTKRINKVNSVVEKGAPPKKKINKERKLSLDDLTSEDDNVYSFRDSGNSEYIFSDDESETYISSVKPRKRINKVNSLVEKEAHPKKKIKKERKESLEDPTSQNDHVYSIRDSGNNDQIFSDDESEDSTTCEKPTKRINEVNSVVYKVAPLKKNIKKENLDDPASEGDHVYRIRDSGNTDYIFPDEESVYSTTCETPTKRINKVNSVVMEEAPPKKNIKKGSRDDSTSEDDHVYSIRDSGNNDYIFPDDESDDSTTCEKPIKRINKINSVVMKEAPPEKIKKESQDDSTSENDHAFTVWDSGNTDYIFPDDETEDSTTCEKPTKRINEVNSVVYKVAPLKKKIKKEILDDPASEDDHVYRIRDSGNNDKIFTNAESVDSTTCEKPTKQINKVNSVVEKVVPPKKKIKKESLNDSTSEDDHVYSIQGSETSNHILPVHEISVQTSDTSPINSKEYEGTLKDSLQEGNFVVVSRNNQLFPGLVLDICDSGLVIDFMTPTEKAWKWPVKEDILPCMWCEIKKVISPPKLINKGLFAVTM